MWVHGYMCDIVKNNIIERKEMEVGRKEKRDRKINLRNWKQMFQINNERSKKEKKKTGSIYL